MGETKIDRRRRYTLSVIREAFFALLAEVGFAKMTVADICRRAEINRGTFYLHYEDKYALLDALIDEAPSPPMPRSCSTPIPKGAYWRYPLFAIPITHRDLRFRNTSLRALSFGGCG
ncbi:TetR/AcrR family transcriptional regulator [Collinsella sp. AF29-7AC]|uniref:TetR/AcrR family transcriptional regulator n=1 Tax=Collinsella sp. AF29-7AC TaxID=2292010 RepID=UPI000E4B1A09|nr:TetR/AcrR family transcriptional regulator [Collinsella sp. AF29-7AC]RHN36006.1 TetR/AcrR family transcriptional regulator [Collinsella sp. AF29-7AC]